MLAVGIVQEDAFPQSGSGGYRQSSRPASIRTAVAVERAASNRLGCIWPRRRDISKQTVSKVDELARAQSRQIG